MGDTVGFLAKIHIYCFLLSYLVSLGCEILQAFRKHSVATRVVLIGVTTAGLLAHTAFLLTRSTASGLPPLLTSQQDWLLVLAWIGSLLYLVLMVLHRQMAHGLFLLPAIVLLIVIALFVSPHSTGHLDQLALRRLGMFHAASLVLGIAAVVGAGISGVMYLMHHQRLRNRSGWLQRLALPSLEVLTGVNRWMVVFSVPCLTIGLVTGFILIFWSRAPDAANFISWSDPTIVTTVLVWVSMIIVLIRVLLNPHQTGKAVAQLSILSGGFLLTTVLGPMILSGSGNLSTFHSGSSEQSSLDRDDTLAVPNVGQREGSQ